MVKTDGKMDGDKYRTTLEENLLESAKALRLGQRLIFQQDNDPKHKAKSTVDWFRDKHTPVLEWPGLLFTNALHPASLSWMESWFARKLVCKEEAGLQGRMGRNSSLSMCKTNGDIPKATCSCGGLQVCLLCEAG
ncbi:hypothetical protein NFI96_008565 [Prochilodus magdalenae]|nr:hypothetical protein NFI96_008565 [Prochilodus magdalenae]